MLEQRGVINRRQGCWNGEVCCNMAHATTKVLSTHILYSTVLLYYIYCIILYYCVGMQFNILHTLASV